MNIKSLKLKFINGLQNIYDSEEIESFFFILTEYLHQLKRIDVALNPEFELSEADVEKWSNAIKLLQNEKPIQYITGTSWFYGLQLQVNKHTLIPRPETEELVAWILQSEPKCHSQKLRILDIGTGSGCIAIGLAKNLPKAQVYALDNSEKALEVAKSNAFFNDVTIEFIKMNILEVEDLSFDFLENQKTASFDIIVSNPPYVRLLEKNEIKKNVLDYEPHQALFVDDEDALLFYRKIGQLALKNIAKNGLLFFEINQYLGNETVDLLKNIGYKNIELKKDIYGNDRMIKCEIEK